MALLRLRPLLLQLLVLASLSCAVLSVSSIPCLAPAISIAGSSPTFAAPLTADTVDLVSNSALASGTFSFPPTGSRGSALSLQYAQTVLNSQTLQSSTAYSFCLWFRVNEYRLSNSDLPLTLVGAGNPSTNDAGRMCLGVNQYGVFFIGRGINGCLCYPGACQSPAVFNAPLFRGNGSYTDQAGNQHYWTHVCYVYGAQTASIYVNGTLGSTTAVNLDAFPAGDPLGLGITLNSASNQLNGSLQCVAGWNSSLSAQQVYSVWYNQQSGGSACQTLSSYTSTQCTPPLPPSNAAPVFLTGATRIPPLPASVSNLAQRWYPPAAPAGLHPVSRGPAPPPTYYISQLYGNDNNTGLSPAAAWQSLYNLGQMLWTDRTPPGGGGGSVGLKPGTTVLMCNGDRYHNQFIQMPLQAGNLGSPTQPLVFANYACRPVTAANNGPPLLSQSGILPQTTGVTGWQFAPWTFANGTTSTSSVLAYNLSHLATVPGGAAFFTSLVGYGVGALWVNGSNYYAAQHPNFRDPQNRQGLHMNEYMWTDGVPGVQPAALQASGGSYCGQLFQGLYGGNLAAFKAGAGKNGYYVDGTTSVLRRIDTYASAINVITSWKAAAYSCTAWYKEYVTNAGYTYDLSTPWVYTIPLAQSASDPHSSNPIWRPLQIQPNNVGSSQGGALVWRDELSRTRQWVSSFQLIGHSDFLDGPCEYYWNATSNILYIIPCSPAHQALLLTTYSTAQVPFTLVNHSLALAEHGLNSAPAILLSAFNYGAPLNTDDYTYSLYAVIHDLEFAYDNAALSLRNTQQLELYNVYAHDLSGTAFSVGATDPSAAAQGSHFVYNNVVDNVAVFAAFSAPNVYIFDNTWSNAGLTNAAAYTGITAFGNNYTLVRGNTLSNSGGYVSGLIMGGPTAFAEHNVFSNMSLTSWDSGAFCCSGNYRYNQLYGTGTNTISGWVGTTASISHGFYFDAATYQNVHHNLIVNVTGGCYSTAAIPNVSFTNNLCIDSAGSVVNPIQIGSSNAQATAQGTTFYNNWDLWVDPLWDDTLWPIDAPYSPQRQKMVVAGYYWLGGGISAQVLHAGGGGTQFPFFNRTVYCNGFLEGAPYGTYSITPSVAAINNASQALLTAMSESARSTEAYWAFSTDQVQGGLQYGQANCRALAASASTDLLAYSSVQRAATELAAWKQAFSTLPYRHYLG